MVYNPDKDTFKVSEVMMINKKKGLRTKRSLKHIPEITKQGEM